MLEDAIKDYNNGDLKGKKAIVLHLDESSDCYAISYHQSGLKSSEILTLLEVAKIVILKEMNYIHDGD
jgi:tRNA uridine 5-carbamoylmethylation protein Kti12